uniref:Oxidoreductase-like domain-containing protein n=1 Tax=Moniliophthora roreri TaxID=221103 RepID=A0A0W0FLV6_MONRR
MTLPQYGVRILPRPNFHTSTRRLQSTSTSTQRPTQVARGGQNLTNRYVRLEKSLRGKKTLESDVRELQQHVPTSNTAPKNTLETFRGVVIPVKPKEPASDECCMSGCAVCVYDLYDESLAAYRESMEKVKATLRKMGVPEEEWPISLAPEVKEKRRDNPTLSAFEEMERMLKLKGEEREKEKEMTNAATIRPPKSGSFTTTWNEIYEGVRWVLFSNR